MLLLVSVVVVLLVRYCGSQVALQCGCGDRVVVEEGKKELMWLLFLVAAVRLVVIVVVPEMM